MNRRNFLKLSAVTGIAALVPLEFIIDNRDNETKFLDYIITTYDDEVAVVHLIKKYGWSVSQGRIIYFFKDFVKRQPHVVAWLKERIHLTIGPNNERFTNNPRYNLYRSNGIEIEKWMNWGEKIYPELERKFNLKPKELSVKKLLA